MSNIRRQNAGLFPGLYWTGMVMTLSSFALILLSNTDFGYGFEHTRVPLSWMLGGMAVVAFVVAELCHPAVSDAAVEEEEDRLSVPVSVPEYEVAEVS